MKRTWTIIGVRDVPASFRWYQSLFGQPETPPGHDHFGQILHQWGAHEHPSLMSPDKAPPGNGLLLFFRVDDFDMALKRARALVTRLEEEPHVNPNTQTAEFSLRDPDGYYVTISALSAPRRARRRPDKRVQPLKARGQTRTHGPGENMKKSDAGQGESASELISKRITELGDWRGKALSRMRTLIKDADPDVVEELKWVRPTNPGTPTWSHDGIICTGEPYKSVVKLTFAKGASLKDPARLFNSSLDGNVRRAIDIREGEDVDESAFKALVRQAVALNRSGKSKRSK
jgi:catechol 2,3-dioxygenase-like lactoylglutathione lyase family enzyme